MMTVEAVQGAFVQTRQQLARYDRYDDYYGSYNETSTRYMLIDPVLAALGWNIYDLDQCAVEWPLPESGPIGRADYVLGNRENDNVIVIEAKSIKVPVGGNPRALESKLAGYTQEMATGIAVLTNGLVWRLYELDTGYKEFKDLHVARVDITGDDPDLDASARTLHRWLNKRKWW